jgi:uncharacterized protein (TIGR02444 family)
VSSFWDFSVAFYARPGVQQACLAAQDEGGADVIVILYALYLAHHGRALTASDIATLDTAARPWREAAIEPLRVLRRRLKGGVAGIAPAVCEELRDRIKSLELEAEHIQHSALIAALPTITLGHSEIDAVRTNAAIATAYWPTIPSSAIEILFNYD